MSILVEGHKVFVTGTGLAPEDHRVRFEVINDGDPVVRMVFDWSPDEAREVAGRLLERAERPMSP